MLNSLFSKAKLFFALIKSTRSMDKLDEFRKALKLQAADDGILRQLTSGLDGDTRKQILKNC
jgi:hypothetical protein